MKRTKLKIFTWVGLLAITFMLVLTIRVPAIASTAKHYTELTFPPLEEVKIPEYQLYQLDNGMTVYLMEDHELPLVSGKAVIRTGGRLEPAEKVGLAELVGVVMRSGGTKQHPPDELNEILEQKAATVETSINTTAGNASFNSLSEDLETVFNLFAEVLRQPAFPADKLELAKQQLRGGIARRNDNPGEIASREFGKLIYGDDSPYARTVEYTTLDNISRDDLVNFSENYFHPERIILGIVGDFETKQIN